MTISVRRIAVTVSLDEFQTFISEKIPDGDPIVKSFVNNANRAFKSATVTFKGSTKAKCKATIEKLRDSDDNILIDDTGTTSTFDFDGDFIGITELANRCAHDEEPYFEYVFREFTCLSVSEHIQRLFCSRLRWSRIQLLPSQGEDPQKKQYVGSRYTASEPGPSG